MYATNSLFNTLIATYITDDTRTRDVLFRLSQKREHRKYHHELPYRLWRHRILVASDWLFALAFTAILAPQIYAELAK